MKTLRDIVVGLAVLFGAFTLFVYWRFSTQIEGTAIPTQEVFETLIANPVPDEVTELQGRASNSMQGYLAYLRFRAPSLEAAGLTSPPYQVVDCSYVKPRMQPPERLLAGFSPDWEPPSSATSVCVEATDLRNNWAAEASNHALFADGWIHFTASGD